MSSIMRRRNGLIAWSVMGRLLSGGRDATPHLQTGRACYLSPLRALGDGALPRERFSPLAQSGRCQERQGQPRVKRRRRFGTSELSAQESGAPCCVGTFIV